MTKLFLTAAALLLCSHAGAQECIDDLNAIANVEIDLFRNDNGFLATGKAREYILCPNTQFDVGTQQDDSITYTDGSLPLVILNPNVIIKCGMDGKASNDCVIRGGKNQVLSVTRDNMPQELQDVNNGITPDASNLLIQGVTFEGATDVSFSITNRGSNIVVQDCIFRNQHEGDFVAYVDSPPSQGRKPANRRLADEKLTYTEDSVIDIKFLGCLFQDNTVNMAVLGSIDNVLIHLEDNLFQDNVVPERSDSVGSILWLTDGTGSIKRNCWKDNRYALSAALVNGGLYQVAGNYVDDKVRRQNVGCDHLLYVSPESSLGEAIKDVSFECKAFPATRCLANPSLEEDVDAAAAKNNVQESGARSSSILIFVLATSVLVGYLW